MVNYIKCSSRTHSEREYNFERMWQHITYHSRECCRLSREQTRALLERPVNTNDLTIYRNEDLNESKTV